MASQTGNFRYLRADFDPLPFNVDSGDRTGRFIHLHADSDPIRVVTGTLVADTGDFRILCRFALGSPQLSGISAP